MGVFDFVRDVGAKVGIGKSTDEKKEEAADEAKREAAVKAVADRKTEVAQQAKREATQAARDGRSAERERAKADREKAKAVERFAEYKKSNQLEKYVRDLGITMTGVDIRFDDGTAYIEGEAVDQATKEKIILAVGNAEGVGRVDEEITVADPAEQAVFHTVASGDTLWAVAEKVYGDGNRYTEIFEANKPMLTDPDLIYPGQVLRCPK